jgi:hypothetical protein
MFVVVGDVVAAGCIVVASCNAVCDTTIAVSIVLASDDVV